MPSPRTTREVVDDHLRMVRSGNVDDDLNRNYSPDVVCFIRGGIHRGHDGVRELSALLDHELPDANFEHTTLLAESDVAFLEWTATSARSEVRDGADSFVVRGGRIVAQTIHYSVEPRPDTAASPAPRALHHPDAGA